MSEDQEVKKPKVFKSDKPAKVILPKGKDEPAVAKPNRIEHHVHAPKKNKAGK